MKKYWLLIDAGDQIDAKTKFFSVKVGDSVKDAQACQTLQMWCAAHGIYFEVVSPQVDEFYFKIAHSLGMKVYQLPKMQIDVMSMVKYIRNNGSTPGIPPVSKSAGYALRILAPDAYFKAQINVIQHAEASQRKKPKADCNSHQSINTL